MEWWSENPSSFSSTCTQRHRADTCCKAHAIAPLASGVQIGLRSACTTCTRHSKKGPRTECWMIAEPSPVERRGRNLDVQVLW